MAALTVDEMRTFVKTHLDTDSTELPNEILDAYRVEAENRISMSSERWSFYEYEWDWLTVADEPYFSIDTANAVLAALGAPEIQDLIAVQGPRWRIDPRSHEVMQERFEYTTERGEPRFWTEWGKKIYLWPTPGAVYALKLRGYKKPNHGTTDGGSPDLPHEFHPLIQQWMLGRAYQQQDDVITSPAIFNAFERELQVLRKRYESVSRATTRTLGGVKRSGQGRVNGRLLFPWE